MSVNYKPKVRERGSVTHDIAGYNYAIYVNNENAENITFRQIRDFGCDKCIFTGKEITIKNNGNLFFNLDKWISKLHDFGMDSKGSIYLVTDGAYTKIGATSYNVSKRLNELQTGNAKKLRIIDSYKVENKLTTERFIHNMFSNKHILGEWFNLNDSDIHHILNKRYDIKRKCAYLCLSDSDISTMKSIISMQIESYIFESKKMKRRFANKTEDTRREFLLSLPVKERLLINQEIVLARLRAA